MGVAGGSPFQLIDDENFYYDSGNGTPVLSSLAQLTLQFGFNGLVGGPTILRSTNATSTEVTIPRRCRLMWVAGINRDDVSNRSMDLIIYKNGVSYVTFPSLFGTPVPSVAAVYTYNFSVGEFQTGDTLGARTGTPTGGSIDSPILTVGLAFVEDV